MIYGYARVSTRQQANDGNSLESQENKLRENGATKIFVDSFTGKKIDRPKLKELLQTIQPGDTLVVCKLERIARSVSQASEIIIELIDRNIKVHVLDLGILDKSSVSTLMRNILLAFAQLERDMIVERTQEGKSIARLNPNYKEGRPKKYSTIELDNAMELLKDNSYTQVESLTGISVSTLVREKRRRNSVKATHRD